MTNCGTKRVAKKNGGKGVAKHTHMKRGLEEVHKKGVILAWITPHS